MDGAAACGLEGRGELGIRTDGRDTPSLPREIALRRKACTGGNLAGVDEFTDLLGDLRVQASRLDALGWG